MEIVYYQIQIINYVLTLFNWCLKFKRQREAHANYHLFHFTAWLLSEWNIEWKERYVKRYATTYWNA